MYLIYIAFGTGHWKKFTCHDKYFLFQKTLNIAKIRENIIINSLLSSITNKN